MSDASSSLSVEFVGVPGVGKSTLATDVGDRLEREGFVVHQPTNRINAASVTARISKKAAYSGFSCLTAPRFCLRSADAIPWSSLADSSEARSVYFNWFFVNGVIQRYRNRAGLTLLDQGPLQGYWSIALSEPPAVKRRLRAIIEERYRSTPTIIVQVTADRNTIHDRLAQRDSNPSRVNPTSEDDSSLEAAFETYDETRTLIDSLSTGCPRLEVLTVTNEVPADIDTNVAEIVDRVEKVTAG